MNHHHEVVTLPVGGVSNLEINIPVTTIGTIRKGLPHLALVCGVHGDETASLVICRRLVEAVMREPALKGAISIVTSANPFAQATGTRVNLIDFYDLNRMGQGSPDGVLTERVAGKLYEFLSGCSFVIDIHEFEMETPTMAVYFPSSGVQNERVLRAIRAFRPATVWSMNVSVKGEVKYSRSFISALIDSGVPGFAVETSRASALSDKSIREAVGGLLEVAKLLRIIEGEARESSPPSFARRVKHSDQAGIWTPAVSVMNEVRKGDGIGSLTSLDLLKQTTVVAPEKGTLIQLRGTELVATGTSLFTIGV